MADCAFCGASTELYYGLTPICLDCVATQEDTAQKLKETTNNNPADTAKQRHKAALISFYSFLF
jgi:hypothetical protein